MSLLEGRTAIISGVGPGLGRDIALALATHGADLVLAARRPKRLAKVAEEVLALGRRVECVPADITDAASCRALADAAVAAFGRIDVLVNNAFTDGAYGTLLDGDLDEWRVPMEVNFFGTLQMTRAVAERMRDQGEGRIVMVNSMAVQRIEATFGAYAASKAALASATRTLARELGPDGIRVNAIHPGYIWGPSVEWYLNHLAEKRGITFDQVYDELAGETCLGYLPSSEEIAGSVVFFASDLSRPVTGQALGVNAGHWFTGP